MFGSLPYVACPSGPEGNADFPRTSLVMVPMPCKLLKNLAPIELTGRNKECDYSAAYIVLKTSGELSGQGMTFSTSPFPLLLTYPDNQPLDEEMRL
jgi:hypothetical protein